MASLVALVAWWSLSDAPAVLAEVAPPVEPEPSVSPTHRAATAPPVIDSRSAEEVAFDREFEEMVAPDLHCLVLGVPKGTRGQLRAGMETLNVDVYKPEIALVDLSRFLDPGSGELHLEGFEPVALRWWLEGEQLVCNATEPASIAGPFGIAGLVLDPAGLPLTGVEVRGCGDSTKSQEGAFYLIRSVNQACELRLTGPSSGTLVVVPAAEEDLELGEVTLPDVPSGIGLDLTLGVMAFQGGVKLPGFQVLQVLPGSPADRAGLRPQDVVTQVDGVATSGGHPASFFERPVGESLQLELSDGRQISVTTEPLQDLLEQAGKTPEEVEQTLRDRGLGGQY